MSLSCFIYEAYISLKSQKGVMLTFGCVIVKKTSSVCTPAQVTVIVSKSLPSHDRRVRWNQSRTAALFLQESACAAKPSALPSRSLHQPAHLCSWQQCARWSEGTLPELGGTISHDQGSSTKFLGWHLLTIWTQMPRRDKRTPESLILSAHAPDICNNE